MKRVMVIYEGVADIPLEELDGLTPLQVARSPHASRLAKAGKTGLLTPVREGLDGRNEVTLGALLGLSSERARRLQRGPVEAAGLDRQAEDYDYAYSGNFVTLDGDIVRDSQVQHLSFEETRSLAGVLQDAWDLSDRMIVATAPARVVVLCNTAGRHVPPGYPPCFVEGGKVADCVPKGKTGGFLRESLAKSREVLLKQTVNDVRLDLGENPANAMWLWGGGAIETSRKAFKEPMANGLVLSQSALGRGMARLSGMDAVTMRDPWRLGKGESVFEAQSLGEALEGKDFMLVYVEAQKKLGQFGSAVEKVRALESLDHRVLGPLLEVLESHKPYRILLTSDGLVSTASRRPASGNIPVVLAGEGVAADDTAGWNEQESARGSLGTVKITKVKRMLEEGN